MARSRWWRRVGSSGRFRYLDARGNRIDDPVKLARIDALRIPPAWRDVCIAPSAISHLQAVGYDAAGRKQYLYHPDFRAAQEQAKYEKLIRFAEKLPSFRATMAEHISYDTFAPERICAVATRLINLGWFRVGSEQYAKSSRTFGITTLRKTHVKVGRKRIEFRYRGKHKVWVHRAIVDAEIAVCINDLVALPGDSRLFRYEQGGEFCRLTARHLNYYIQTYLGNEFTAKDFRTWGGTLLAAVKLAEHGPEETATRQKRVLAAVMRSVGEELGNTPAVARASYVSPAVVEQYLEGRTIDDFRPRHLRVVSAREIELAPEEQATLSLLRSWRIRERKKAA